MTKAEFVKVLMAGKPGVSEREASSWLDLVTNSIKQSVAAGESVALVGFGTFKSRERAARVARNPKTNEEIQVPAKQVAVFTPSLTFKREVAGN